MNDHEELADQREAEADRLERENEHVGEGADAARDAHAKANADSMIPEALGEDDPGRRADDDEDQAPEK
ncbi:MAG: hypothetical protein ACR2NB_14995 [Solirubrobacteraceae bacterium]